MECLLCTFTQADYMGRLGFVPAGGQLDTQALSTLEKVCWLHWQTLLVGMQLERMLWWYSSYQFPKPNSCAGQTPPFAGMTVYTGALASLARSGGRVTFHTPNQHSCRTT